jgi:hypothetical protein
MSNLLQRSGLLSLALCLAASSVFAESSEWDAASAAYGRGVHAYFAGRYTDADTWLSRAQANQLKDPRPYYFRALTLLRLGRSAEAREEFGIAASFEADTPNRYAVGSALQRVQGSDRLLLEKHRRMARTGAQSLRSLERAPVQNRTFDADVLYQPVVVPLDEFFSEGNPRSLSAEEIARSAAATEARAAAATPPQNAPAPVDPFEDDAAAATPAATTAPPAEPVADADDTAAESPAADEQMPAEDPEAPAEEETPAEPAGEGADDPFGDF